MNLFCCIHTQIFIHIVFTDGGSENANKYLFAALEFLVIKRLVKKILLTRYIYYSSLHLSCRLVVI